MGLSETATNMLFIAAIVVLLIANFFLRKRKSEGTPLGKVVTILSALTQNQKMTENFSFNWKVGKFNTASWRRNKGKLEFLPPELMLTLSNTFDMTEEFNQRIDAAKKYKSSSYMAGIEVDKLKTPLAKSRQELHTWLQANMQNPEFAPKRRGLFG